MKWLDPDGEASWPVAYHGTKSNSLDAIFGSQLVAGQRNRYGVGVYCAANIKTAEGYCDKFQLNGETYKFVFKCRVNPKDRVFCNDKELKHKGDEDYWFVTDPNSIRYYKLCIKKE